MEPSLQPAATHRPHLTEGWSAMLEDSTREVFEIMLGSQLVPVEMAGEVTQTDLTGIVGMAGNLTGVLSIRCTVSAAARMASLMLGTETSEVDESVKDALGEVCNMIAGNFKSKVKELSEGCLLSVPTVISGADYHLYSLANGDRVVVALSFEGRPVSIILDIHN